MKMIISGTPAKLELRNDKDASIENTSQFEHGLTLRRAERRLSPLSLIKVTRLTFFFFHFSRYVSYVETFEVLRAFHILSNVILYKPLRNNDCCETMF